VTEAAPSYHEEMFGVPHAVFWRRTVGSAAETARILPDGCIDLLWDGRQLAVAGPDLRARRHLARPGAAFAAVRFSGGLGPALIGVPADELVGRTVDLADLWASRPARLLLDQVAADPAGTLPRWVQAQRRQLTDDPLGAQVLAMAGQGLPVRRMADVLNLSARQLHRRCLPLFGYGPRRLGRILRLHRALEQARSGLPWSTVAVESGYADQAHLSRDVRELTGTTPRILLTESAGR
jgi:AraC-like DNA-binding protein